MFKKRIAVVVMVLFLFSSLSTVLAADSNVVATPEYRLSKYDVINIAVLGLDESNFRDIMIGADGYVNLPYTGVVKLSGLTVREATSLLKEKLGEYIKIPGMAVMIKSYGPRKVYVMGEVTKPGIYDIGWDRMNVVTAISSASGIGLRGHPEHVHIVRVTDNKVVNKEINFKKLLEKADLTQNVELLDGDLVYVPHSGKIDFNADILPFLNVFFLYKAATN